MNAPADSVDQFVGRYVSMWNEADPARRRRLIEDLWAPDCANFTRLNEYRGWDALEARVRVSWEKWGRDEKCLFRTRHFERHHDALRFTWEMVNAGDGKIRSVGIELLLLARDGRIRADYQFIEP
jgi:hypothetical protein